jgi:diacylglycerol O-acyltransferase
MDRRANTTDVVALLQLSDRFRFEEFHRLIEPRLLGKPQLRRRIVRAGILPVPCWEEDPDFALLRHVVLLRPHKRGRAALQELVSAVATEPLDLRHPPWKVYLVEAAGRGSAIIAKLHHCMGDGTALVGLLLSLMDEPAEVPANDSGTEAARRLFRGRSMAGGILRRGGTFVRALLGMAALSDDPRTLLRCSLSGRRRLAWSRSESLRRIQRVAREHHATVNDMLVAALAGALRRYLKAAGEPVDSFDVRALMPVNLRAAAAVDSDLTNRFGLVFLDIPIHCASGEERLEAVKAGMRRLKRSPDSRVTFGVLGAMGRAPVIIEQGLADFFTRKASLVVTNVPGPRQQLHLGGVRLNQLIFWVPHAALLGLGISILSYAGEVRVGVRADEAVLSGPAELVARFEEELAGLLRRQRSGKQAGPVASPRTPIGSSRAREPTIGFRSIDGRRAERSADADLPRGPRP